MHEALAPQQRLGPRRRIERGDTGPQRGGGGAPVPMCASGWELGLGLVLGTAELKRKRWGEVTLRRDSVVLHSDDARVSVCV